MPERHPSPIRFGLKENTAALHLSKLAAVDAFDAVIKPLSVDSQLCDYAWKEFHKTCEEDTVAF